MAKLTLFKEGKVFKDGVVQIDMGQDFEGDIDVSAKDHLGNHLGILFWITKNGIVMNDCINSKVPIKLNKCGEVKRLKEFA